MTLTFAFLLASLGSHAYARCPLGFVQGPDEGNFNVCYYYINQPLTWFQAEVECNLKKAHLTSIKDLGENTFLAGSARSTEVARQHFWIGGSRGIQGEGGSAVNWTWIDGESFTYTQWAVGQPAAKPQRSCIWTPAKFGTWVVDNCTKALPAICKVRYASESCGMPTASTPQSPSPTGTPKTTYKCPTGFVQGPEDAQQPGCFYYLMEPMAWLSAEPQCNRRNGHLASIEDLITNNFIAGSARLYQVESFWVGGSVGISSPGNWTWTDDSPFVFAYWGRGQPNANMPWGCLRVDTAFGWWLSDNCTVKFPAVCKVLPSNESCASANEATTRSSLGCVCPTSDIMPRSLSGMSTLVVTTTAKPRLSEAEKWLIPVVIGGSLVFLVLWLLAVFCAYRYYRLKRALKQKPIVTFPDTTSAVSREGGLVSYAPYQDLHMTMEIPSENVRVTAENLGRGKFSDVFKGFYTPSKATFTNSRAICDAEEDIGKTVAVKLLRNRAAPVLGASILCEAKLMQQLGSSKHILCLLGLTFLDDNPAVLVEFCGNRDLLTFLRTNLAKYKETVGKLNEGLQRRRYVNTDLSLVDLVQFSWQISDGMTFLHLRNYVHRGLCAAKVLVTSKLAAKISGFGLGRYSGKDLHAENLRAKNPMNWMAPESLADAYFTRESDV